MTTTKETPGDDAASDDFLEHAADRLLAVAGDARKARLAELITAHPGRANELRELCVDLDEVDRLLDAGYRDAEGSPPPQIGGHRVLRWIGAGAFGLVYLCQQQRPVVREVAIKVLRPGVGDPKTLLRFTAERQLLADLNHHGIPQVYDAGELPDGRPYFVMEYVDGTPIHAWCKAHGLSCQARIRLFVDLCRAVAHAHARGIVHRDLKPANVLVVATSDGPVPKIIDFGIAKAIGGHDEDAPRTEAGRVVGTPGYMSPEQAAGRIDEVDERADVFALGVMLYQLLTDAMPWQHPESTTDTEPARPSTRVTSGPGKPLAGEVRGDLDWITLRAIARDRQERYPSVTALVADLERHLRGDTVSAGPPSLAYRLRKFARRRRAILIATSLVALAATGLAFALHHAAAMSAEASEAHRTAAAEHAGLRDVVARMLARANDPALYGSEHGDELRRAFAAEAAAFTAQLQATNDQDPQVARDQCEALQVLAEVQRLIGEARQAAPVAAQAIAIAARLLDAAPADLDVRATLGRAMRQEAWTMALVGDRQGACRRLGEAVTHLDACATAAPAKYAQHLAVALADLGNLMPAKARSTAIPTLERAIAVFDSLRGDPAAAQATRDDRVAAALGLARLKLDDGDLSAAWQRTLSVAAELPNLGPGRLRATCEFHRLRAAIAWARGERRDTVVDCRAAADAGDEWCRQQPRRTLAHRTRLMALDELGRTLVRLGDQVEVIACYRRAAAATRAMVTNFPDEGAPPRVLLASRTYQLANALAGTGRYPPLAEAAENVAVALEVDAGLGDEPMPGRISRWRLLLLRARIADGRGEPTTASQWHEIETAVPTAPEPQPVVRIQQIDAFLGIAQSHLDAGDPPAATVWIERARAALDDDQDHLVDAEWLAATAALARNDDAGLLAAVDRMLQPAATAHGLWCAAEGLRRAALRASDPTAAAAHRQRSRELFTQAVDEFATEVAAAPDEPRSVVPWATARIRLAELAAAEGDTATAATSVDEAIARLDAVRAETRRDAWDDDAYAAGVALRERLRH